MSTEKHLHLIKNNNQRKRKTKINTQSEWANERKSVSVVRTFCVWRFSSFTHCSFSISTMFIPNSLFVCIVCVVVCSMLACVFFFSLLLSVVYFLLFWWSVLHANTEYMYTCHGIPFHRLLCIMWNEKLAYVGSFNTFSSSLFLILTIKTMCIRSFSYRSPCKILTLRWKKKEIITNYSIIRSDILSFFWIFHKAKWEYFGVLWPNLCRFQWKPYFFLAWMQRTIFFVQTHRH